MRRRLTYAIFSLCLLVILSACYSTAFNPARLLASFQTKSTLPEKPETLADIQRLLQEPDENCRLPCFWNIRPGYTTEAEIVDFLQPVAMGSNPPDLVYAFPSLPNEDNEYIFSLSSGTTGSVVSTISVLLNNPLEWLPDRTLELSHFLTTMSYPDYAYLSINITTGRLFLTLAYAQGIFAQYTFDIQIAGNVISPDSDEPFLFCPALKFNRFIRLELRDGDIATLLENYGYPRWLAENRTWTVEHMTGLTADELVRQIVDQPDACIELPSYPELQKMGYSF